MDIFGFIFPGLACLYGVHLEEHVLIRLLYGTGLYSAHPFKRKAYLFPMLIEKLRALVEVLHRAFLNFGLVLLRKSELKKI